MHKRHPCLAFKTCRKTSCAGRRVKPMNSAGELPGLKKSPLRRKPMESKLSRTLAAGTILSSLLMVGTPHAQTAGSDDLLKMEKNAANVVMPTNTYDNQRYSSLSQINASNVSKLQVAWTFSTGVLRGHEGAPLVIGDVMYFVTPFPNIVYALDL